MAFTEDLTPFLDQDDFAVAAVMGAATFSVIFDRAYLESVGVSSTNPVAVARTADVSSATRGTAITIAGTAYTVREVHPDGTGMSTLILDAA